MLKDKSSLVFDLSQEGLLCVLLPWQAEVMRFLWSTGYPEPSRTVYEHLQTADIKGAKSRASVINFLNYMVDEGLLGYVERTGKGGYHRVYSINEHSVTEAKFRNLVAELFCAALREFKKN